mgnify:CR=1 FL=1
MDHCLHIKSKASDVAEVHHWVEICSYMLAKPPNALVLVAAPCHNCPR